MQTKTFFNWTEETFLYPYAGEMQAFASGQSTMMEAGRADFFAKHLADWYMNLKGIQPSEEAKREEFKNRCLIAESPRMSEARLAQTILNQEIPPTPEEVLAQSEAKPKKSAKKAKEEPEFAGV